MRFFIRFYRCHRFSFVKQLFIGFTFISVVLQSGFPRPLYATEAKPTKKEVVKQSAFTSRPDSALININNISMWIYANGISGNAPDGNAGIVYPAGTGIVGFIDGIVWGGRVRDGSTPLRRVGGQTYSTGVVPGRIVSKGIPEDHQDPNVNRVWRIRRDFSVADLTREAAELNLKSIQEVVPSELLAIRSRYRSDWMNWPWQKGAPFYDADGDGIYSPQLNADGSPVLFPEADEPGLANADQVVWFVSNDLHAATVQNLYGSPSIGLEVQTTLWAYKQPQGLANTIFKRYRLIYKGTAAASVLATIDSMHIAQWADPDIGVFPNDLVGCDILLNLGYCYNSAEDDAGFAEYGLPPPAVGYDLIGGALQSGFPGRQAIFDLKKRSGFRNLNLTGFGFWAAGGGDSDPTRGGDYNGTRQWWNVLRGFRPRPESPPAPYIDPTTGSVTRFLVPGDPIAGWGWIDSNPGDRRLFLTSGAFDMSLGDTNEFHVALVGGLGSDRLNSITALRFHDRYTQQVFDNLFELPMPPEMPTVSATEFDGQILLNWGEHPRQVSLVESARGDFHFEGYNVYQLPSSTAGIEEGVKLATFDIKNDVRAIIEEVFDPNSGAIITRVVQFGRNEGIARTMTISRDSLNGEPLYNGQEYHFAVTAYNFNPDPTAPVKTRESKAAVVTVKPQSQKPGVKFRSAANDTLPVLHVEGVSHGKVVPLIIDPSKLTGDDYKVFFTEKEVLDSRGRVEQQVVWHLLNITKDDTVLTDRLNQSGDNTYLVVDGIQLKVIGAAADYVRTSNGAPAIIEVASEKGPLAEADFDEQGRPFGGNLVWHSRNSTGHYYVSAGGGGGGLDRLQRYIIQAVPNDYEIRFTEEDGWAVFAFTDNMIARVPFEIWNIGVATVDDPSDDVRMIPFLNDNVATSAGWGWATGTDPAFGYPMSDWIYWMEPEDRTPGTASYDHFSATCEAAGAGGIYPYATDGSRDGYWADFQGGFVYPIGRFTLSDLESVGRPPPSGTVIRVLTTKTNSSKDVFTFSTAAYAPTFSKEQARKDIEQINVFPNPYYGPFDFSTRFPRGFVTFNHLPDKATVRIFTLAGTLVRRLEKNDAEQFLRWDLKNGSDRYVAGGIYLAHIEMRELSVSKVLKLAVFPD